MNDTPRTDASMIAREKADLDAKIGELAASLPARKDQVELKELYLLEDQLTRMRQYSEILGERIALYAEQKTTDERHTEN